MELSPGFIHLTDKIKNIWSDGGKLCFSTGSGIFTYDDKNGQKLLASCDNLYVENVLAGQGCLYLIENQKVYKYDGAITEFKDFAKENTYIRACMHESDKLYLSVNSNNDKREIITFDTKNNKASKIKVTGTPDYRNDISSISKHKDTLYFGSNDAEIGFLAPGKSLKLENFAKIYKKLYSEEIYNDRVEVSKKYTCKFGERILKLKFTNTVSILDEFKCWKPGFTAQNFQVDNFVVIHFIGKLASYIAIYDWQNCRVLSYIEEFDTVFDLITFDHTLAYSTTDNVLSLWNLKNTQHSKVEYLDRRQNIQAVENRGFHIPGQSGDNFKNCNEKTLIWYDNREIFDDAEVDEDSLCPITLEIICEPVVDAAGRVFEKSAIHNWLDKKGSHPFTRKAISKSMLIDITADHPLFEKFQSVKEFARKQVLKLTLRK